MLLCRCSRISLIIICRTCRSSSKADFSWIKARLSASNFSVSPRKSFCRSFVYSPSSCSARSARETGSGVNNNLTFFAAFLIGEKGTICEPFVNQTNKRINTTEAGCGVFPVGKLLDCCDVPAAPLGMYLPCMLLIVFGFFCFDFFRALLRWFH